MQSTSTQLLLSYAQQQATEQRAERTGIQGSLWIPVPAFARNDVLPQE